MVYNYTCSGIGRVNLFLKFITQNFKNKSIQKQLLFTHILVILAPIIIISVSSYFIASKIITEDVMESNELMLEGIEKNINLYLKDVENDADIFSTRVINSNITFDSNRLLSDMERLENINEVNNYLYSTFDSTEDYYNIRIFSDNGTFVYSAYNRKNYNLFDYNTSEEMRWQNRMFTNNKKELIYDVHPLEEGGELSFVASKPVINEITNRRIGYISFDKTLESFASIFEQFENRKGGIVQVVDSRNKILYHTDTSLIGSNVDTDLMELLQEPNEDGFSGEVKGEELLVVSRSLADQDLMIIGSLERKVLSEKLNLLRNLTIIISVIALIFVFILSVILSIGLSKPIKKLTSLMSEVEKGNLEVDINVPRANIETDVLTRSFRSMVNKIKSLIRTQYESEIHRKNAELKALLMQINPHFLYNTLEVIEGIAEYKGIYEISDISQSLSKMLRYSIDLKQDKVKIQKEIENCLDYFLILKSRFEDQLIVDYEIDPETEGYTIPKMVLQPLVENSIKHGVEKKIGKGFIALSLLKEEDKIVLQLIDNGVGFEKKKFDEFQEFMEQSRFTTYSPLSAKSLGLKNVYSRLRMVFGGQLHFDIQSNPSKGTTITIKFPAIEYDSGVD